MEDTVDYVAKQLFNALNKTDRPDIAFAMVKNALSKERKHNNIQEIANRVCGDLPEGYSLMLAMARGCADVMLETSDRGTIDVGDITNDTELTIEETIDSVLNIAVSMER